MLPINNSQPDQHERRRLLTSWRDLSLRSKIILSMLVIEVISLGLLAYIGISRAAVIVNSISAKYQDSVKADTETTLNEIVRTEATDADMIFSTTLESVVKLASARSQLEAQNTILGGGAYWDARVQLFQLPEGQYGNSEFDPSSVTLPSLEILDDAQIIDLNTSSYLDFYAPGILETQPEIVAIYYISQLGGTTYYPNINLISLVPADFDARTQPFYTIVTPQNNPEKLPRWTDPYQDPAGTGLIVTVASPVYSPFGRFIGVMGIDMQLARISERISQIKVGETGFAFLVDSTGRILAMPPEGYALFGLEPEVVPVNESPQETILGKGSEELQAVMTRLVNGESGLSTVVINGVDSYIVYTPLNTPGYSLGVIVPVSEMNTAIVATQNQIRSETTSSLLIAALILVSLLAGAVILSIGMGRLIAAPLLRLTGTVEQISSGDFSARAEVESKDETGKLATAFNQMASQVSGLVNTLEQRVADRTRGLELAADVGRSVSQVRELDIMLRDAAEIIRARFDLYYTQVYLLNPAKDSLLLEAGTGEVGEELIRREHRLPMTTDSINGRAAIEKHSIVIADTGTSATFRPNPLLPDTRSEMAVPLLVGETVVGVLDMQSARAGALNEETLPAFEALAGQLAVAIQNANLLNETEQARAEVEAQARRLVRTNWQEYLDAIHKPENLGFVYEGNDVVPFSEAGEMESTLGGSMLSAPIALAGETFGTLRVETDSQAGDSQNAELVNIVARQVAQQIENLRILDSAERYRYEAEEASRRMTREGWKEFVQSRPDVNLSYFYNLNEVQPHPIENDPQMEMASTIIPIKIRDEKIGRLVIKDLETQDSENLELASQVAERLASHIETLRQFDQTQSALAQSEKLFEASRVLTQASDLQELLASTVKMLDISEINRATLVTFEYDKDNQLEGLDVIANWWSGAGREATPIGTHYSQAAYRDMPLFLSPEPVFFGHIFADERSTPEMKALATNLGISAIAVLPLHIGAHQIGALILEADHPHNFTNEETRLFVALAPQMATVLGNRRQFERARQQAEREAMLNTISQKIQSATTVEAVLQIAARELGRALNAPMTIAQLGMKDRQGS